LSQIRGKKMYHSKQVWSPSKKLGVDLCGVVEEILIVCAQPCDDAMVQQPCRIYFLANRFKLIFENYAGFTTSNFMSW
jgi:hypothetical protein